MHVKLYHEMESWWVGDRWERDTHARDTPPPFLKIAGYLRSELAFYLGSKPYRRRSPDVVQARNSESLKERGAQRTTGEGYRMELPVRSQEIHLLSPSLSSSRLRGTSDPSLQFI